MRKQIFCFVLCALLFALSFPAQAQQSAMPIVGWLNPQPLSSSRDFLDSFRKGLGEAGFVEGKNVMIELRPADGKRGTQTIPIVFTSGADPVKNGLVSSYNRPGGNVTGFHIQFFQLVKKRFSLLHEAVPQAARIAVLNNPANPSAALTVRDATETARALGRNIQVFNAGTVGEIDTAFAALVAWRAGAVFVGPDPVFGGRRNAQIVTLAARHMLPTSVHQGRYVEGGGLMTYAPDISDMYRRAGGYVGRILKGEKPADMPVQQPTKFELIINLKTAKALGLTIPPSILYQATKVIK